MPHTAERVNVGSRIPKSIMLPYSSVAACHRFSPAFTLFGNHRWLFTGVRNDLSCTDFDYVLVFVLCSQASQFSGNTHQRNATPATTFLPQHGS